MLEYIIYIIGVVAALLGIYVFSLIILKDLNLIDIKIRFKK